MKKTLVVLGIAAIVFMGTLIGANYVTASLTHVTVHNETDVIIVAQLKWASMPVSSVKIQPHAKGQLPCEYVWYDLFIYSYSTAGDGQKIAERKGIYGYSSWVIKNTAAPNQKPHYVIEGD